MKNGNNNGLSRRSAVVQGRDLLRAARALVLRQQRRRGRRFSRPDAEARLSARPRRHHALAAAVLSVADARRRLRHLRLHRRPSRLRHAARFQSLPARGASSAVCAWSPSWCSIIPRTSIHGFNARAARRRAVRSAIFTSGAIRPSATRTRASSSRTSSRPTGPGIRWPRRTTGIASTRISRISTTTIRRVKRAACSRGRRLLARDGRRRAAPGRGALPLRARRHELREPARDPRLPARTARATSTRSFPTGCCSRRPINGPRTRSPISAGGKECHMAFHFPLMPRMFMAVRMEDRFPLTDIWAQTPPIDRVLPVGDLPAQSRRADARDGDRRGARLHVSRVRAASRGCESTWAFAAGWRRCSATIAARSS